MSQPLFLHELKEEGGGEREAQTERNVSQHRLLYEAAGLKNANRGLY